ncbi:Dolichyl-phosphate-mannose-protein mannosyltransferase [Frankia sp. EI5c]|uniref:dolichyl-phosphate-mannose--protein mannosyltransferase n=1 Tax=Frankia sp. EI5c TaxID=683316 RepID=UPI0007C29119|nr:phospholipid carrier-dependent glycosyltransferase [Frankia sp. EI5c]OAA27713.1 Dolichyl-phosphate-mannose-protein mannosyltransferase [Frankia sp. EI5c]
MPSDRALGWAAAFAVTAVAAILRFWRLTEPKGIYFDEVYYTKDAWGLMTAGYEVDSATCTRAAFVVHPPLGKWFIAASEKLFGYVDCAGVAHGNPELGWRFASAFFGTLAVLVLTRLARRVFRSTLLGCFAGLLLALDGLEFVQSRIGILDIFLMTGLVLALACLVLDRDDGRARLAERLPAAEAPGTEAPGTEAPGTEARYGPRLGWRPWRIAAGVCLGASMGVKWSALYTLVGLAALALAWDIGARRTAGARAPVRGALRRDLPAWLGCYVLLPIGTFLSTWTGWFVTDGGYRRHEYGDGFVAAWRGWWSYQEAILEFHEHLSAGHVAQSTPLSWLVMGRPVAYAWDGPEFGEQGCRAAEGCAREVLALGNPAVWWVGTAALVAMLALWASRRDWRAALVLVGFGASFLPWLAFPNRTMFFFYALPLLPFMILGITACAGLLLGPRTASDARRLTGAVVVGSYLVAVILLFAYYYPILAAEVIPLDAWRDRMWFPGWVVA